MKPTKSVLKKHVIIFNDSGTIDGGATKVAIDQSIKSSKKYLITYVYCFGQADERLKQNNINLVKIKNSELRVNNSLVENLKYIFDPRMYKKIRDFLKLYPIDNTIVHIHNFHRGFTNALLVALANLKIRSIITCHDYFLFCPNGAYFNFKKSITCDLNPLSKKCLLTNCDKRNYLHKLFRFLRTSVSSLIMKAFKGNFSLIYVSPKSKNIFLSQTLANLNYYDVTNPLPTPKNNTPKRDKKIDLTYIGKIAPEKGIFNILPLFNDFKLNITIIGDGEKLNELIHKYPNINFVGWKNSTEIGEYLEETKYLIFPSIWDEVFGLSVIEAASYGVPSIMSDKTGAASLFTDKYDCYIYNNDNLDELKEILKVALNNEIYSFISKNCFRKFNYLYDNENSGQNLFEAYDNIFEELNK